MGERSIYNGKYSLVVASGADIIEEFVCTLEHEVERKCHFGEVGTNCNGVDYVI